MTKRTDKARGYTHNRTRKLKERLEKQRQEELFIQKKQRQEESFIQKKQRRIEMQQLQEILRYKEDSYQFW